MPTMTKSTASDSGYVLLVRSIRCSGPSICFVECVGRNAPRNGDFNACLPAPAERNRTALLIWHHQKSYRWALATHTAAHPLPRVPATLLRAAYRHVDTPGLQSQFRPKPMGVNSTLSCNPPPTWSKNGGSAVLPRVL